MFYLLIGQYNWQELADNYVYLSAIIWFPEAMLNGMAITLLITYRPHWVKTFYDKDYLDKVKKTINPYGDGTAGEKIADVLATIRLDKELLNKRFVQNNQWYYQNL